MSGQLPLDGRRLRIAYLGHSITRDVNRTRYQRPKHLADTMELYLFVRRDADVPEAISSKAIVIRSRFNSILPYLLWSVWAVWWINRRLHLDVVYTSYPIHSLLQGLLFKSFGLGWVADIWDHPEQTVRGIACRAGQRLVARSALQRADLVVCALAAEALDGYGIDPAKVLHVTNGTDLMLAMPSETLPEGSGRFTVLYVGPLHENRDIGTLLEAMSLLLDWVPNLRAVLVGSTSRAASGEINDWLLHRSANGSVELLGATDHQRVLELISGADVCMCPLSDAKARRYAYPIKLFEYLAMGKAVVATSTPGVSRIVTHEVNGLLVEPGNARQMAEAVLRLHDEPELRGALESRARDSVRDCDWALINSRIERALYDVVGGGGTRGVDGSTEHER